MATSKEELDLKEEDIDKVVKWFNKHIKKKGSDEERGCHICGNTLWYPHGVLYTPVVFNLKKNHHVQDKLLPCVAVECHFCSTVTFLNANKIGIDYESYAEKSKKLVKK